MDIVFVHLKREKEKRVVRCRKKYAYGEVAT